MGQKLWTAVDRYISERLIPSDAALDETQRASLRAGFPSFDVAPNQGKMLHLLARIREAKKILEIGTFSGYSAIWLARALPPDGKLVSLELDPKNAAVASANLARAGLSSLVEIRTGQALKSLSKLYDEGAGPFDLVFIDADKRNHPAYLEWALRLSRPGTVIVADNVVREGAVLDAKHPDPDIQGVRRFCEILAKEPRLDATALQTVGSKGHDGFCLALVVR